MTELNKTMPALPARFLGLPIDERGFPVPWFVGDIDGKPDFRVIRPGGLAIAHRQKTCWLCGQKLGQYLTFVIGPMCAINRTTSEPPSHRDCAEFAARACPFLTKPSMRRNEKDLPEGMIAPAGVLLSRNPGVTCLWVTKSYSIFKTQGGVLIRIGEPIDVQWYREGRAATLQEVNESIEGGMPSLLDIANKEGPRALRALRDQVARATKLFPKAA